MTIRGKITFGFFITIVLLTIISIVAVSGNFNILNRSNDLIYGFKLRTAILQREIDHLKWSETLSSYVHDKNSTTLEIQTDPHKCAFGKWYDSEKRKEAADIFPGIEKSLVDIEQYHSDLHKSVIAIVAAVNNGNRSGAVKIYNDMTMTELHQVQDILRNINVNVGNSIELIEKKMHKDAAAINAGIIALSIIAIISAIIMSIILPGLIIAPIKRTINILNDITSGKGDLTKRLPMPKKNCSAKKKCGRKECPEFGKEASCWDTVGSNAPGQIHCPSILSGKLKSCTECFVMQDSMRNEVDELSGWFNTLMGTISEIIRKVKHATVAIGEVSEKFSSVSGGLAASSEEMTAQAHSVAGATEQMTSNISSIAGTAEEISVNTQNVSSAIEQISTSIATVGAAVEQSQTNLTQIETASEGLAVTAEEIAKNTEESRSSVKDAVLSVKKASLQIQQLSNASQEISKVIEAIEEVAEQTKLLALNATIEAARAGEAGKGFSVVANEVRELAKQTNYATADIRKRIGAMQRSTESTVNDVAAIEKVITEVDKAANTIALAVEGQNVTIKENVRNLIQASNGARRVSSNVIELNAGVREIARNVSQVADGAHDVSTQCSQAVSGVKEVSSNIQVVSQAATDTSESAQDVNMSAVQLSEMAVELQKLLDQFRV